MITFAHLADTHIGSWRDEKMRQLSVAAFTKAVDICIEEKVDFVLISGDFFDTSIPPIDKIKSAVIQLKRLKESGISVYIISGSHDHSPSGKTMLDVLEEAGLFVNVVKGTVADNKLRLAFTTDIKTGTKITGILGKRGTLEKSFYEQLDREWLESEIRKEPERHHLFMFHSALEEFKPENAQAQESMPLSLLPKGFDYYAGGHVHTVFQRDETAHSYGLITYPGPLFPCDFREIEELKHGGFYIVAIDEKSGGEKSSEGNEKKVAARWQPVSLVPVTSIKIPAHWKTAEQAEQELRGTISALEKEGRIQNAIVTIRIAGVLSAGSASDMPFNDIISSLYAQGAFFVMKNTAGASSVESEEIQFGEQKSVEEIREKTIREHLGRIKIDGMGTEQEYTLAKKLLAILAAEKNEGETAADFEERIIEEADEVLRGFFTFPKHQEHPSGNSNKGYAQQLPHG